MKIKWKQLVISLAIPLVTGGAAALLTNRSMDIYDEIVRPALAPPGILFPIVWTVLYILMGISSYLVCVSDVPKKQKSTAMTVYYIQLAVNFLWPIIFFRFRAFLAAFVWLVVLWVLIITMIALFGKISKASAYFQIPYLLWVSFAGYLNLMIYLLN